MKKLEIFAISIGVACLLFGLYAVLQGSDLRESLSRVLIGLALIAAPIIKQMNRNKNQQEK